MSKIRTSEKLEVKIHLWCLALLIIALLAIVAFAEQGSPWPPVAPRRARFALQPSNQSAPGVCTKINRTQRWSAIDLSHP
jgi:hypothetical protein